MTKKTRPSWDNLFMGIANQAARRAACIYYKIGAVFVDHNHRIISIGYNGPSVGDINCTEEGYCVKVDGEPPDWKIKRCNGAHAEMNAIVNSGDTMRLHGSTLYTSIFPCYDCMKVLNNAGVKRIVYENEYERLIDGEKGKKGEREVEPESLELANKRGIMIEKFVNSDRDDNLSDANNKEKEKRF